MSNQPAEQPSLWMRWRYGGLIAVGILVLALILYIARGALFPFIASIVLAELIYPFVEFAERWMPGRRRYPAVARIASILLIYAAFLAIVAVVLYLTLSSIISEGNRFVEAAPELFEQARTSAERWYAAITDRIPPEFTAKIEEMLESATGIIASAATGVVLKTLSALVTTVSFVIGLLVVPILLFYLLKDKDELLDGVYAPLSSSARKHTRSVLRILHSAIGSYVRAQLISVSVVGVMVYIGLTLLGIEFALILAMIAAITAIIPIVGAIIGAVPGLLIALASDPDKVLWVLIVYVLTQFIESNVITPRLQANAVRLHPVIIMAIIVIGAEVAGIWGMIVGVPLCAAARDVFVYFQQQWRPNGEVDEQSTEMNSSSENRDPNPGDSAPETTPDTV